MNDGSIVFNTKIDSANVEKDLKDVEKKIRSAESSITKSENAKLPFVKQAEELSKKLDEAKAKLQAMQQEMKSLRDITLSPDVGKDDYLAATDRIKEVVPDLLTQEQEVQRLQQEWEKANAKVGEYNQKIQQSKQELELCQTEAGRLRANLAKGGDLSAVFEKAGKSADKFRKRLMRIGASVFIFSTIRSGLRAVADYMGQALRTNAQYNAQLAQLKVALRAAFQPIYEFVLPGLIAVLKLLTQIVTLFGQFIATLMGKNYSQMLKNAQALYNQANAINAVGDAAKKATRSLAGFDEINRVGEGNEYGNLDPSIGTGNLLGNLDKDTTSLSERLKAILGLVTAIGAGLLAWKISKSLVSQAGVLAGIALPALGLSMFISDMREFSKYLQDFLANGATLENVVGMLSEFSGAIGDIFLGLGKLKIGGALKVVQGIGEIFNGVRSIFKTGFNWNNVYTSVEGITNVVAGIGAMLGMLNITGFAIAIQGAFGAIKNIAQNWEAIKNGDFSVFKSTEFITNLAKFAAGLAVGFLSLKKIKAAAAVSSGTSMLKSLSSNLSKVIVVILELAAIVALVVAAIWALGKGLEQVGNAWGPVVSNGGTIIAAIASSVAIFAGVGAACYALGTVGKTAAVNIAIGMAVMLEIAVAALLFAAEVAVLGAALETAANAWNPVVGNGETAKTAILASTVLLIGIGAACFALGKAGASAAVNIAAGAAVMLEIAVASALFIAETYVIGKGLEALATAWEPVIQNGDTVKTAILAGTAMLAAVGAAAAALGAITIASGGTIPVAIAIGTAVLVEMAAALVTFTASIVVVANQLSGSLAPAMARANAVLPELTANMANFTKFMSDFATQAWNYTKSTAISAFSSVVDSIIQMFAGNPLERFASNVDAIGIQARNLNAKLQVAIPELQMVCQMLENYQILIQKLNELLGMDMTITDGAFVNLQELGTSLVTGLAQGMVAGQAALIEAAESTKSILSDGFILPLQELFTQFYVGLDTQTTSSTQLITTSFMTTATTISTSFIMGLTTQFMTFFTMLTTNFTTLQTTITTMFQQSYASATNGFIMPLRTQMTTVINQLRTMFSQLQVAIISAFQQAAAGTKSAFAGVPGWFSSSVYSPIMSMIHQMISEMTSAIAQANAAIASMQARTYSARATAASYGRTRFFANGGTLRSGWGVVGEVGPELIHMVGGKAVITPLNVPRLAQGAVLPANKPFMAMVGDQTHGTNVEAPLETIKQAVFEVIGDLGPAMMAGFEAVVQAINEKNMSVSIGDSEIGEANDRYSRRMAVRRGG